MEEVQKRMFYCDVAKDEYIFKKGDPASCYMIIETGEVVIEDFKKVLKKGDSFGELALIYNAPRSASVKSLKNVGLWCLSRTAFKQTMTEMVEKCYGVARPYMDRIRIFKFLTAREKDAIAHAMVQMKFEKGEHIFKQNEDASTFAIVKEGNISIEIDRKEINRLKEGDCFGEQAFIEHSKRTASAVACDKVIILSIHSEDVQRILGA
jgi:CRP-like cAMP-binding protein